MLTATTLFREPLAGILGPPDLKFVWPIYEDRSALCEKFLAVLMRVAKSAGTLYRAPRSCAPAPCGPALCAWLEEAMMTSSEIAETHRKRLLLSQNGYGKSWTIKINSSLLF